MSRTYVLTMTRPHERFGLSQPIGRQLALHAQLGWNLILWAALFAFAITYVSFMITASAKGFELRDVERRVERLRTESRALETQVASISSVQQLTDRARSLGFVAVDRIESLNAAGHSYALAR
ncbi:hypothetical protein A3E39_02330 [Candidatus Uhrbacteria bacterium RIFCSPHIGHO2_12_FULL_60_25]|uniref:Uncharacterized protein n=1 Tax=Candidatus Uhrbacteria bacterium RIFCSPHIGHO2_12_FULL_60_25 TaxID=1802399 RepID=A0A1F7UL91_9BACT|nr:MAG: hypothetical protein A3D73_00395 [Candidatus Uhrbacteria bacterium RIFCSPHIGHO2_02_FULL_60_44]OGL79060.1 MAG: hypothetical protein A3E39_02330 [Candidatus Uhrbacteria bacterium RIFCSPHIGHO2_12_FULL_60_25]